jgi:hypothetical protein
MNTRLLPNTAPHTNMATLFDENNPWHVQADFAFMFYCETSSCDAVIDFGDLAQSQRASLDFPGSCVALSELAQSRGWTCVGQLEFLCPACSAARPVA